jgi:hypothetical protein
LADGLPQARALFSALYARLTSPLLDDIKAQIRAGVSYHVASCAPMVEDPAVYFDDLEGCRFQEEAVVTCMLLNRAPWDDYIRRRIADVERGSDHHPIFASVIGVFFGGHYYGSKRV